MDSPQDRAFRAILNFVNDLWSVFQSKEPSPLAFYHRLLQHITFTDKNTINRVLGGFFVFVSTNNVELTEFPSTLKIAYSDRVFLDIGHLFNRANDDTKRAIRHHLLNISAIMLPSEDKNKKLKALLEANKQAQTPSAPDSRKEPAPDGNSITGGVNSPSELAGVVDDGSAESKLIKGILAKVETAAQQVDASNPTAAITQLMSSGVMTDLFGTMQSSVESGDINPQKLLGTIQQVMGNFMGGGIGAGSDANNGGGIGNMFSGLMGVMAGTGKHVGHGTASVLMTDDTVPVSASQVKAALEARQQAKASGDTTTASLVTKAKKKRSKSKKR